MRSLMLFLIFASSSTFALALEKVRLVHGDPAKCAPAIDAVREHLDLRMIDFPAEFQAGHKLSFSTVATTKVSDLKGLEGVSSEATMWLLTTVSPYPKSVEFDTSLNLADFFFSQGKSADIIFTKEIPPNIAASFSLEILFHFVLPKGPGKHCFINGDLGKNVEIKSEHPDMTPPFVRGISFSKSEYSPGEEVTVTFKLSEPLRSPESNHIAFMNPDLPYGGPHPRDFPAYLANDVYHLTMLPDGDYQFKFTVPVDAVPGKYYLEYFNRYDSVGNDAGAVGNIDLEEKQIATQNPLMIK